MTQDTINDDLTRAGGGAMLANRYRIVRQLGQGGMGSVWLAEDTLLDNRQFAIKMLPTILVSNKRAYRQMKDEALVAMKLTHQNIVTLRAFEENNGNPFLVMDYVDGQTLDDYLADKGKLGEDEVIRILRPIAAALDYAHGKGVVHRDVKPANVMIAKDGTPFILDFGIAREIQETLTRVTGKLSSGTLLYMSPEQLNGAVPKPAQDIYSFAAMAYECLKGEPPFVRGAIEDQIKNKVPEPLNTTSSSPKIGEVAGGQRGMTIAASVMAGLAKKPEDRPASCAAVLEGEVSNRVERAERVEMVGRDDRIAPPRGDDVSRRERKERKAGGGKALAIFAFLAALAGGGVWFSHQQQEAERGVVMNAEGGDDSKYVITFLVDVSGSMKALDLASNSSSLSNAMTRLDIVKRVLSDYAIANPTRQFGLVSFAGFATIHARPGCAHNELLNQIAALEVPALVFDKDGRPYNSDAQMTSAGEGLAAAISVLNTEGIDSKRVIVLLSDGVSNSGKTTVEDAICMAVSNKVHICTIGIGTNSNRTPFRVRDSFGRISVAYANTSFDSSQLKAIASSSGGRFADITNEQGLREAIEFMADPNTELPPIPQTYQKNMHLKTIPNVRKDPKDIFNSFFDDSILTNTTKRDLILFPIKAKFSSAVTKVGEPVDIVVMLTPGAGQIEPESVKVDADFLGSAANEQLRNVSSNVYKMRTTFFESGTNAIKLTVSGLYSGAYCVTNGNMVSFGRVMNQPFRNTLKPIRIVTLPQNGNKPLGRQSCVPTGDIMMSFEDVAGDDKNEDERKSLPQTEVLKALAAGEKFNASHQLAANEEQRCISLISRRFYECWTDFNWSENLRPALLSVRFGDGGKILGYRIVQSSGDAKVDQSVLTAAKRADPVSELSAEFIKQYPEITISMTPKRLLETARVRSMVEQGGVETQRQETAETEHLAHEEKEPKEKEKDDVERLAEMNQETRSIVMTDTTELQQKYDAEREAREREQRTKWQEEQRQEEIERHRRRLYPEY